MRTRSRPSLASHTVLVTGGARGIGAATARALVDRGASVALLDRSGDAVEATAAALGPDAAGWRCDVTDAAALERTVEAVLARFGAIDVVLANAGVLAVGTVEDGDAAALERVIEVNLLGVLRTIRATLPALVERRGYLLAVSSVAAAVHFPLLSTYCASKAGVEALTEVVREEVAASGVGVGVAYFGFVDTGLARQGGEDPTMKSLLRLGPGFASRPITAERAAASAVRGIERRARRVCAPRWVLPVVLAPGLLDPLYRPLLRRAIAK